MKRSARLEKITDINLGFENIAGLSLASAKTTYAKEEQQLQQLRIYKKEYQHKLKNRLKEQISPNEMQDYQYFFISLDKAITQQAEVVENKSTLLEQSRQNWLMQKMEVSKFQRVTQKLKAKEAVIENVKEQKEADEQFQNTLLMTKNTEKYH
ncbi:MAG: flagellar export protein FliJ [SAR86 cluster bacterium]|uniref:Flagellar FliJ protein n=1 Tax=SAR86 cluster bacterium TaxID=2030880 RepID=A0A2A5CBP2_9GAMM|nr:flagellar export protein FliJ [Gammaproteobacteria bacterium AH-315-E17]PCJ40850.1 MAG: flagellar export protein FliJ [SAR86 cluster bacterium]